MLHVSGGLKPVFWCSNMNIDLTIVSKMSKSGGVTYFGWNEHEKVVKSFPNWRGIESDQLRVSLGQKVTEPGSS